MPIRRLIGLFAFAVLLVMALPMPAHAQDRRLIYQDLFTNNAAGWERAGTYGEIEFPGEGLQFSVNAEGQAGWMTPNLTVPDDIDVEVEAQAVDPASNGSWNLAVLLRATRRDVDAEFYHFGVSGSGFWELNVRPVTPTSYANRLESGRIIGFNANRPITLRVSARGNTFTFSVNGRQVKVYQATELPQSPNLEKYIGLMAGNYSGNAKNTIRFKKITVWESVQSAAAAAPTEVPADPNALLVETFPADNPNGWGTGKGESSDVKIENGSISFNVLKANVLSWSQAITRFPRDIDVSVTVQNETEGTNRSWSYGLGVRAYKEDTSTYFYLFEVRGTGRFTFTAQRGGSTIRTIIRETALPGFRVNNANVLRIKAVGNRFELYFNGVRVGTATATDLKAQDDYGVLLSAGTFDAETMQARFRNLRVVAAR